MNIDGLIFIEQTGSAVVAVESFDEDANEEADRGESEGARGSPKHRRS